MLGYLANDADYLRFARLDPHSIFTSYIMPSSWGKPISFNQSDEEIKGLCKEIKERCKREKAHGVDLRQDTAKPCVLGNQLGLGPQKLWYQNRRAIRDKAHAEELQSIIANLFPKVEAWKERVIEQAHRQTYLIDEWGKVQFFYEVFRWEKNKFSRWVRKRTQEAEKVLAFRVQGCSFGMLKDESLRLEEMGANKEYNFINTIHDSLVFLPRLTDRDKAIKNITGIMNSPCKRLVNEVTGKEGLVIRCEVESGKNFAQVDMDKNIFDDGNPEGMKEVKV